MHKGECALTERAEKEEEEEKMTKKLLGKRGKIDGQKSQFCGE